MVGDMGSGSRPCNGVGDEIIAQRAEPVAPLCRGPAFIRLGTKYRRQSLLMTGFDVSGMNMAKALSDASGSRPGLSGGSAPPVFEPPGRPGGEYSVKRAYAAIDLGTNNCRLLIARPTSDGFVVVDSFSRIVRLGEGLARTGNLNDAAIERAVGALAICADKMRRRPVHLARSVATEACRRAANGRDFVGRVLRETGIALDIISPAEEARLAVMGCHALLEPGDGPALIFDIGGGSTELILVDTGRVSRQGHPDILSWYSAPWGVVSLSEHEEGEAETAEGRLAAYRRMRELVQQSFADFALSLPRGISPLRLLGTSGTVTTLGSYFLNLPVYDRRAVDGLMVGSEQMRAICRELAGMSCAERSLLPCIGKDRADLVVAGCAILEAIIDLWPAERLGVADRGIREGILRGMMPGGMGRA